MANVSDPMVAPRQQPLSRVPAAVSGPAGGHGLALWVFDAEGNDVTAVVRVRAGPAGDVALELCVGSEQRVLSLRWHGPSTQQL